jgi:hypothetical protein
MDLTGALTRAMAGKSDRRQLFKLLGAGALGTGLFFTRTGVSLGAVTSCVGCGGGPCNPCFSPAQICDNLPGFTCKTCQQGGGCPDGCITSGEWFCCLTSGRVGCRFRCSECNCGPNQNCNDPACHCFSDLAISCTPRLHSGEHPCDCPSHQAPIPALAD